MYYKIQDFFNDWDMESKATLKYFNVLTDKSLNQKVYQEGRTLGFLAWHITGTIGEMMNRCGLNIETVEENGKNSVSAKAIHDEYKKISDSFVNELKSKWKDDTLLIEDDMYGEKWKRGSTLYSLITHQIHHRGQMSVLMRQAGLKVPGFYGPSKEEWAQFGMQAPA